MKQFWPGLLFFTATLFGNTTYAQVSLNLNLPNHYGLGMVVIEQAPANGQVQDDDVPGPKMGVWRAYDHCYGIATVLFGHSAHPGGDHGGRLNQNNDGTGARCYLDYEKTTYAAGYALVNSQYSNTLVFGLGRKLRLVEFEGVSFVERVSLDVGGEALLLYYERYFGRGAVLAPVFLPNASLALKMRNGLEISFLQIFLPFHIKLWGNIVEAPPALVGNRQPYMSPNLNPLILGDQRSRAGPMIVINWRF